MAEDELELDVNQSKGSKMTLILLIVLIVLVLIVGGVGAWLLLGKKGGEADSAEASHEATEKLPIKYQTMVPEFIVNFGPGSKVRYLQVDLQIATRSDEALKVVNTYRPVIRNDILLLLSSTTFEELNNREGKERLQRRLLNVINRDVVANMHSSGKGKKHDSKKDHGGSDHGSGMEEKVEGPIENVYFTSFIMQ